MYQKYRKREHPYLKQHPWLWIVIIVFGFWILSEMCASGPDMDGAVFPGDNRYVEDAYIEDEIREGRNELDQIKNDPCLYDIYLGVPEGLQTMQ